MSQAYALIAAQTRSSWLCRASAFGLGLVLAISTAFAQDGRTDFDIPAQPLASALVQFADKTGMAALIDGELASGLQSSPVKGQVSPPNALRILLAGTGLSIRYAGANAFTVGIATPKERAARPRDGRSADYGVYFSQVQSILERTLCRNDDIRLGQNRAAFQIWVGDSGAVQALHFLGSTGDETRDAMITGALMKASVAPPPHDLPQPLTVILQPKTSGRSCAESSGQHP
ncbi:energy transducer TonB [Bradyrhizobium sp. CSA112]|uniref:secretin and TonB N-terminal domain-containing protein n=1 Tax=Bradyrhizobium sp. CSA112 TaxID=2699170 RepID=UPI0023AE6C40|nr:secretin and TonB N-terminal domain-containing protein [Bradyrhizobium sp. CSA112]MDE5457056.1 energy transducer TonB [Bradyrhizobium sp. CSA112]